MSGPAPQTGVGALGIFRTISENAVAVAAKLREDSTSLRSQADLNDRHADLLDRLYEVATKALPPKEGT